MRTLPIILFVFSLIFLPCVAQAIGPAPSSTEETLTEEQQADQERRERIENLYKQQKDPNAPENTTKPKRTEQIIIIDDQDSGSDGGTSQ